MKSLRSGLFATEAQHDDPGHWMEAGSDVLRNGPSSKLQHGAVEFGLPRFHKLQAALIKQLDGLRARLGISDGRIGKGHVLSSLELACPALSGHAPYVRGMSKNDAEQLRNKKSRKALISVCFTAPFELCRTINWWAVWQQKNIGICLIFMELFFRRNRMCPKLRPAITTAKKREAGAPAPPPHSAAPWSHQSHGGGAAKSSS